MTFFCVFYFFRGISHLFLSLIAFFFLIFLRLRRISWIQHSSWDSCGECHCNDEKGNLFRKNDKIALEGSIETASWVKNTCLILFKGFFFFTLLPSISSVCAVWLFLWLSKTRKFIALISQLSLNSWDFEWIIHVIACPHSVNISIISTT